MKGLSSEIKDIQGNRTEVDIRFNARFSDDVRIEVCDLFHEIEDKFSELIKLNENYKKDLEVALHEQSKSNNGGVKDE